MVREMVDKVRAAEKEADMIIATAQADGANRIKQAQQAAESRKKETVAQALDNMTERLEAKKAELAGNEKAILDDMAEDALKIKEQAAKRSDEVISAVMERIYSRR